MYMARVRYISFQNSDILIALNMSVFSEIYSQMVGEEGQRGQKLNATCREDKTEFDYVRLS